MVRSSGRPSFPPKGDVPPSSHLTPFLLRYLFTREKSPTPPAVHASTGRIGEAGWLAQARATGPPRGGALGGGVTG